MKNIFVYFFTLLPLFYFSQENFKVEYEQKNKIYPRLTNNKSEQYIKSLEEYLKTPVKSTLYYYKGNSFYKNYPKKPLVVEVNREKEGNHTTVRQQKYEGQSDSVYVYTYKNNDSITVLYPSYPNTKRFYRKTKDTWKITYLDQTEKIDNYVCKIAEFSFNSGEVQRVWYTDEIPINAGPSIYCKFLPGLVLKVENERFVLYATTISKNVKESDIEKPDPSLKIYSGKAFDEKMEEIKQMLSRPIKTEKTINL
ncbi:MAG: GLPGLI family protein [Bergeyella sp.]